LVQISILFKLSIFGQNFYFCSKFLFCSNFRYLVKISIFGPNFYFVQNFDIWSKFLFLVQISILFKISIFGQNFDFWSKFLFLVKISIFGLNFYFWPKCVLLVKILSAEISIFTQTFDFWSKFRFLFYQNYYFGQNFVFSQIILRSFPDREMRFMVFSASVGSAFSGILRIWLSFKVNISNCGIPSNEFSETHRILLFANINRFKFGRENTPGAIPGKRLFERSKNSKCCNFDKLGTFVIWLS